jgi:flagellar biosynthesis protein FlhG
LHSGQRDQAEGLRRLLDRQGLRVATISCGTPGSGAVAAAINIGASLGELGRDVLILDENAGERGVSAALGLPVRYGIDDVIRRRCDLDEVIVRGPGNVAILPLARGAGSLAQLPAHEQRWLVERCGRLSFPLDTLLVASACADRRPWTARASFELVVVPGTGAEAITAAYALVKRTAVEGARREFQLLVTGVANESEARAACANLARVARRYLRVSLEFAGNVPADELLERAARLQLPVVTAFPSSASARGFRALARSLAARPRAEDCTGGFEDFMRRLINAGRVLSAPAAAAIG